MQPNGHPAHSNLYVRGLPPELSQGDLQQLFQVFGAIEAVRLVREQSTGVSKGFGFVKFSTLEVRRLLREFCRYHCNGVNIACGSLARCVLVQDAVEAIQAMHGSTLGSATIEVKFADVDLGTAPSGEPASHSRVCHTRVCQAVGARAVNWQTRCLQAAVFPRSASA